MTLRHALVLAVLFVIGCSTEGSIPIVDFSKTIEVARPDETTSVRQALRVAVGAMVSPKETVIHYRELLDYLGLRLDKKVELVQRKTYAEINELLEKGEIDLAFVCSGPYVRGKDKHKLELLAAPEVHGSHFYHSYLIVNTDSTFNGLEDLGGKTFAFTDPDSNTGRTVPTYWLSLMKERPETFFGTTIYTYSHDNSIMAVAKNLVDGAAVDGLIWEYYREMNPALTSHTRIIRKSEPYGMPPVVVSLKMSGEERHRIGKVLFAMHEDSEGREILGRLMIDRFVEAQDQWYDSIREMQRILESNPRQAHGHSQP